MKAAPNPPAFPFVETIQGEYQPYDLAHPGMSLRDWFAGQALAGMSESAGFQGAPWEKLAKDAYLAADAMLAERAKREDGKAVAPDLLAAVKRLSEVSDGVYVTISDAESALLREAWDAVDAAIRNAEAGQ